MRKYKIHFQNYVTKEETTKTIEAKNIDTAFDIARDIRNNSQYFIILSVEELTGNNN